MKGDYANPCEIISFLNVFNKIPSTVIFGNPPSLLKPETSKGIYYEWGNKKCV